MDQLPHAAVCEPKFRGDLVLREALDEDGSQRLVLTVIGRGIGVQEEMSVTRVIHGRPPRVLVDFRWLAPRDSLIRTRVTSQDRRSPSSSNSGRIPENWLPYTWAGQQKHSVLAGRTVSQFPPAKIGVVSACSLCTRVHKLANFSIPRQNCPARPKFQPGKGNFSITPGAGTSRSFSAQG
jgi:hypothetical protein